MTNNDREINALMDDLGFPTLDELAVWQERRENAPPCQWFALCDNAATTTRPNPILGEVPICDRCNAKIEALDAGGA